MEQRRKSLEAINHKIEKKETERQILEREIFQERKKEKDRQHIRAVYTAGLIFEEAGILEIYDHDEILQILRDYKEGGH